MTLAIPAIQSKAGLEAVLATLGFALPPTTVVHVGVGDGSGFGSTDTSSPNFKSHSTCIWMDWGVPSAVLIEADADKLERARVLLTQKGIKPESLYVAAEVVAGVVAEVAARDDGTSASNELEVSFYRASHPRENGLMSPDALRVLWPSLSTSSVQAVKATTIDDVFNEAVARKFSGVVQDGEANQGVAEACWLIVDCLPGKRILSGAKALLGKVSVVCVRALREVRGLADDLVTDATVQGVDEYLKSFGFRRVAFVVDGHPDVGHAVYCRDSQDLLEEQKKPLLGSISVKDSEILELQGQLKQLTRQFELEKQQLAKLEQAVASKQDELDKSKRANGELVQQLQQQLHVVKVKLDEQVKLTAQEQESLKAVDEQLAQAKKIEQDLIQDRNKKAQTEEQARAQAKAEVEAQIQALVKEKAAVEIQRDALSVERESLLKEKSAVQAQVEEQKKLATERQSKIDELTIALQAEVEKLKDVSTRLDGVTAEKATVAQQIEAAQKELETSKANLQVAQKTVKDLTDAKTKSEQALTEAKKDLETTKKSQADLQKQLADKTQELQFVQSTIEALKVENNELNHRQQLMNEELVKAEGQIELIKDLLLREQGL